MVSNIFDAIPSSEKFLRKCLWSYGSEINDFLVQKKVIQMRPVLVGIISIFLKEFDPNLSKLNGFLIDGQLSILEGS